MQRVDAVVEHLDQRLDDDRPHAREAQCQRVGTRQQHGTHRRLIELRSYARGMAAHQIELKLLDLIGRDDPVLEATKAGGDAVGDAPLGHQLLHRRPRALDGRQRRRIQRHGFAVGHGDYVVDFQVFSVDLQHWDLLGFLY